MSTAGAAGGGTECKRRFCLDPSKSGGLNPAFDFTMSGGKCTGGNFSPIFDFNKSTTNTKGEAVDDLDPEIKNIIGGQVANAISDAAGSLPDGNYRGKQKYKVCWDITVKKDKDGNLIEATVEASAPDDNFGFDAQPVQDGGGGGGGGGSGLS